MKKEVIVIRLNPLVAEWYKEQSQKKKMTKSEYLRKILTNYKEQNTGDKTINN